MNSTKYFVMAVCATLSLVFLTGCSPNGWATRDVPDGSGLQKGEKVKVIQKDGSSTTGEFESIEPLSFSEYEFSYAAGAANSLLPGIGQEVQYMTAISDTKVWEGEFAGFDQYGILLRTDKSAQPEHLYLTSITALSDGHGGVIHSMELRNMYLNGELPLTTVLVLHSETGNVRIALDDITSLTVTPNEEDMSQSFSGRQLRQLLASKG